MTKVRVVVPFGGGQSKAMALHVGLVLVESVAQAAVAGAVLRDAHIVAT
jgi:hypothetical protein